MRNNSSKSNYCTNCGYLNDTVLHNHCPVCGSGSEKFSQYDHKLDRWVTESVADNLKYPDTQGMDWGHPNSSLSRHIRLAVFNAINNYRNRK